jgi:hypothetical protein
MANNSLMTNRRYTTPLAASRKFGSDLDALAVLSAAVAYLCR